MKVWLIRWWQEVLSPPKQFVKLDTVFNTVVSYCGVILFIVFANIPLSFVANAEAVKLENAKMSNDVKHVGISVQLENPPTSSGDIFSPELVKNISLVVKQLKKEVLGSETANTYLTVGTKTAQLAVQIEVTAQQTASKGIDTTYTRLEEIVDAFYKEGLAVHLLLSIHYPNTPPELGLTKDERWTIINEKNETVQKYTYVPYVLSKDSINSGTYYNVFTNFHSKLIKKIIDGDLDKKIAVIYVLNEPDFETDNKNSLLVDMVTAAFMNANKTVTDVTRHDKPVPIGIKVPSGITKKSAWTSSDFTTLLENIRKKNGILGYDCYSPDFTGTTGNIADKCSDIFKGIAELPLIEISEYDHDCDADSKSNKDNKFFNRTTRYKMEQLVSMPSAVGFSLFALNTKQEGNAACHSVTTGDFLTKDMAFKFFDRGNGQTRLRGLSDQMWAIVGCSFSDVNENTQGRESIRELCHLGVMSGYGGGYFRPESTLNRAEMTKISLLAGRIDPNWKDDDITKQILQDNAICSVNKYAGYEQTPFTDVSEKIEYGWACSYISYAKSKRILSGYSDGHFLPGQNVKWGETVKLVLNSVFGTHNPTDKLNSQIQSKKIAWYVPYMSCLSIIDSSAYQNITGASDIKRAEAAQLVLKIIKYKLELSTLDKCSSFLTPTT